jgi:hypothetical protein
MPNYRARVERASDQVEASTGTAHSNITERFTQRVRVMTEPLTKRIAELEAEFANVALASEEMR